MRVTPFARLYSSRSATAVIAGVSTFFADWWSHGARQLAAPPREALLTGVGAFLLSWVVSMTPLGARIEALAARFRDKKPG